MIIEDNRAHQRRATRISEIFEEDGSSDGTRPVRYERSAFP